MRIFITGVACVGKTTIGEILASKLSHHFFDLDTEIESFFGTSIERLRHKYWTSYSFRLVAVKALQHLLSQPESRDCVIALPPSGLCAGYLKTVRKASGKTVVLRDTPKNILERITFYDVDSVRIEKQLTEHEKGLYLREIRADISYYRNSYKRADLEVDIAGLSPDQAAEKVKHTLEIAYGQDAFATPKT